MRVQEGGIEQTGGGAEEDRDIKRDQIDGKDREETKRAGVGRDGERRERWRGEIGRQGEEWRGPVSMMQQSGFTVTFTAVVRAVWSERAG